MHMRRIWPTCGRCFKIFCHLQATGVTLRMIRGNLVLPEVRILIIHERLETTMATDRMSFISRNCFLVNCWDS